MSIPAFTADGLLPEGVHDCTLAEIQERFGSFQRTDARCRLFERLAAFIKDAQGSGLVAAVIVDGSFATDKDVPNDIDLIVISLPRDQLPAVLRPAEYNVLSRRQIRLPVRAGHAFSRTWPIRCRRVCGVLFAGS